MVDTLLAFKTPGLNKFQYSGYDMPFLFPDYNQLMKQDATVLDGFSIEILRLPQFSTLGASERGQANKKGGKQDVSDIVEQLREKKNKKKQAGPRNYDNDFIYTREQLLDAGGWVVCIKRGDH